MSKIADFIKKNNLKPKDCNYHTNRTVKSKSGKGIGSIRVLAYEGNAMVEYKCPECSHQSYTEAVWKRPFSVKCEKCNARISVPKLRAQAKREAKAEASKSSDDNSEVEEVDLD
jgi:DNA-directed RNA polymerase subunit RPC12/RpoP